jgi:hypothetical protein
MIASRNLFQCGAQFLAFFAVAEKQICNIMGEHAAEQKSRAQQRARRAWGETFKPAERAVEFDVTEYSSHVCSVAWVIRGVGKRYRHI